MYTGGTYEWTSSVSRVCSAWCSQSFKKKTPSSETLFLLMSGSQSLFVSLQLVSIFLVWTLKSYVTWRVPFLIMMKGIAISCFERVWLRGRTCVSLWVWGIGVDCVQPVAILSAIFWVICSLFMCVVALSSSSLHWTGETSIEADESPPTRSG